MILVRSHWKLPDWPGTAMDRLLAWLLVVFIAVKSGGWCLDKLIVQRD